LGLALTLAHLLAAVVAGAGGQPLAPVTRWLLALRAALVAFGGQAGAVGAALLAVAVVRARSLVPALPQLGRVQPRVGVAEAVVGEGAAQGGRAGLELAGGGQDAALARTGEGTFCQGAVADELQGPAWWPLGAAELVAVPGPIQRGGAGAELLGRTEHADLAGQLECGCGNSGSSPG
jgi:hypothetical protein